MTAPRETLHLSAREIVDAALRDYGGPCSQAYADVLRAYIASPEGGRDALFLEVAFRAAGVTPPNPSPFPGSPATSAPAQSPAIDPLADFVRSTLVLIQDLHRQSLS